MSRRTIVSLTASAIIGIACIVTVSTDAFAYRRGVGVGRVGVHHGGVYRGGVYRGAAVRRGVAVGEHTAGVTRVGALSAEAVVRDYDSLQKRSRRWAPSSSTPRKSARR